MCGKGWLELIPARSPAAGAAFTYRFPGETYTALVAVAFTLTTSAAVANRYPELAILDGDGGAIFRVASPTALVASLARRTYLAADMGGVVTSPSGDESLPFPDTMFPPGFQARITATALDAADQLSGIRLYVRRESSGDWGPATGSIPYQS